MERQRHVASLSSRRAWIEIARGHGTSLAGASRSPHGERGLKFLAGVRQSRVRSRSPHGERGLKSGYRDQRRRWRERRSPHGERGLKFGFEY